MTLSAVDGVDGVDGVNGVSVVSCNGFDLHCSSLGQILHCVSRASWEGALEICGVDFIDFGEVFDVSEEDGGLHHLRHSTVTRLEDGSHVIQ